MVRPKLWARATARFFAQNKHRMTGDTRDVPSTRPTLTEFLIEQIVEHLKNNSAEDTLIADFLEKIINTTILKKLNSILYALLTLLSVMFVLLLVQTLQMALLFWRITHPAFEICASS